MNYLLLLKKSKAAGLLCTLILFFMLFTSCGTTSSSKGKTNSSNAEPRTAQEFITRIKGSKGQERENLFQKAIMQYPDNLDISFANGFAILVSDINYNDAIKIFEEILEKDPVYKVLPAFMAISGSTLGLKNTNQFSYLHNGRTQYGMLLENLSLHYPIAVAYYDEANRSSSRPSQTERNRLLENSLQHLQIGYDLDIIQSRNNTQLAKTLYLLQIARTAELKEDYATAIQHYTTFLDDKSITFDKAGISDKRQPLYAKARQSSPAVASTAGSSSTSSQQNSSSPADIIDLTSQIQDGYVLEIGKTYRLQFDLLPFKTCIINAPRAYKTIVITTDGNVDTIMMLDAETAAEQLNVGMERFNINSSVIDNISENNLNSQITFSNVTVQQLLCFKIVNKNVWGIGDIITVTVQGNR